MAGRSTKPVHTGSGMVSHECLQIRPRVQRRVGMSGGPRAAYAGGEIATGTDASSDKGENSQGRAQMWRQTETPHLCTKPVVFPCVCTRGEHTRHSWVYQHTHAGKEFLCLLQEKNSQKCLETGTHACTHTRARTKMYRVACL